MQVIKPKYLNQEQNYAISCFLAGSIENGSAEDWQKIVENELSDYPLTIFNPRRDNWDPSIENRIHNEDFSYQVNWELDRLDESDIIFMYFAPGTVSPISLLELGIHKRSKIIVCCDFEYWRRGNVEIVCQRYNIPIFSELNSALDRLKSEISDIIENGYKVLKIDTNFNLK